MPKVKLKSLKNCRKQFLMPFELTMPVSSNVIVSYGDERVHLTDDAVSLQKEIAFADRFLSPLYLQPFKNRGNS